MTIEELIEKISERFEQHPERHGDISLGEITRAITESDKSDILIRMEESGGEVDVVMHDSEGVVFFDCSPESPLQRRSVCYDEAARLARKANAPEASAEEMANEIGAEILNEEDYLFLQTLGDFDLKSQCWVKTDPDFRGKGEALFCNKRNGRAFTYYNGVQSYYSNRGFRCKVRI